MPTLYDLATAARSAVDRCTAEAREAHWRDVPAATVRLDAARVRLDAVVRLVALGARAFVAVERGERVLLCVPRHCTARDVTAMVDTWPTLADVDLAHATDGVSVEAHEAAWKGTVIA